MKQERDRSRQMYKKKTRGNNESKGQEASQVHRQVVTGSR